MRKKKKEGSKHEERKNFKKEIYFFFEVIAASSIRKEICPTSSNTGMELPPKNPLHPLSEMICLITSIEFCW